MIRLMSLLEQISVNAKILETQYPLDQGRNNVNPTERPPRLQRQLFPSSDSSSQYEEEELRQTNVKNESFSETATEESSRFKSIVETPTAPIARLESLDELEPNQVETLGPQSAHTQRSSD